MYVCMYVCTSSLPLDWLLQTTMSYYPKSGCGTRSSRRKTPRPLEPHPPQHPTACCRPSCVVSCDSCRTSYHRRPPCPWRSRCCYGRCTHLIAPCLCASCLPCPVVPGSPDSLSTRNKIIKVRLLLRVRGGSRILERGGS